MASSSSFLSEEQFLCSICLDVFTEPVTIPCGHNFCKACIRKYWDSNDLCQCPMCKKVFDRKPDLFVNNFISEMAAQFRKSVQTHYTVPLEKEYRQRKVQLGKMEAEVQQMIQERLQKVQDIKHLVEISKGDAEGEIEDSVRVFIALVRSIEKSQAEFIEVVEEKQKAADRKAEGLIKELQQEIAELQRRSTELDSLPPIKDWSEISVHTSLGVGNLRRAVSKLEETLWREVKKLMCDSEMKRIQRYAVDVTLDPDTAHPALSLSEDRKQVRHVDRRQNLPDNPNRFSSCTGILGKKGFSSGRFYYEVQVKGKTDWDLGVTRESSNRKGDITLSPQNGYWSVWLRNMYQYQANTSSPKVGVFVDYEEGQVSFYDVEARSQIYSFTGCTFTEKLDPYFRPYKNIDGKNSGPLIISVSL
uniref:Uncharacterized protein n=1 Tax=Hucho hucho TaxID=62062 RepID=A0A4W5JBU6_9TELE